jgi:hypothetical protein
MIGFIFRWAFLSICLGFMYLLGHFSASIIPMPDESVNFLWFMIGALVGVIITSKANSYAEKLSRWNFRKFDKILGLRKK